MSTDKIIPMMAMTSWRKPSRSVAAPNEAGHSCTARPVSFPELPYEIGVKVTPEGFVLSLSPEATVEQIARVLRAARLSKV